MISYIKGKIVHRTKDSVIVEANNTGWEIFVGVEDILLEIGQEIELFVHTQIRENDYNLWGFKTCEELDFFKLLITVSGVGGKTAHSLIISKGVANLANSIKNEDEIGLKVSGVGPKTVRKIIIELKDKVAKLYINNNLENSQNRQFSYNINDEIRDTLTVLGYRSNDIENALKRVDPETLKGEDLQSQIKIILQYI